jgi:hypothetical protein
MIQVLLDEQVRCKDTICNIMAPANKGMPGGIGNMLILAIQQLQILNFKLFEVFPY